MNRKLKSGLRYDEVTSADNGAGGDVYVFDGDNIEEEVAYNKKRINEDNVVIFYSSLIRHLEKVYDHLQGPGWRFEMREYASLYVSERMMKDSDFMDYIENICCKAANHIIYLVPASLTENKFCWNRFILTHNNIRIHWIKADFEDFFRRSWTNTFLEEPKFDVNKVLKNLKSYGQLNSDVVRAFVNRLRKNLDADRDAPTEEDIQAFFQMCGRSWKDKLNRIVGHEEVKRKIRELIHYQKYAHRLAGASGDFEYRPIRWALCGSPGVGKSMMLDLIQQAVREEGICTKGSQIVSARNLIRSHVGESEVNFRQLVDKTGLLIIDEIGGLATVDEAFTEGLIQMLVYEMENNRELHIVLAGYESDMHDFFKKNAGLRSRIQHMICMKNYDKEELADIGLSMLSDCGYSYDKDEIRALLLDFAERVMQLKDFGNARAVRSLVNEVIWLKSVEAAENDFSEPDMQVDAEIIKAAVERYFDNQLKDEETGTMIGFRG